MSDATKQPRFTVGRWLYGTMLDSGEMVWGTDPLPDPPKVEAFRITCVAADTITLMPVDHNGGQGDEGE